MKKKHLHTFSFTNVVEDQDDPSNASTAPHKKDLRISQVVSSLVQRSFQNKNFVRKLPILTWVREYKLSMLVADFIAGLTLGLTTIPQVLGVANVAEMPPEYGLYSSFVGCFVYIFLGSTKYITVGPTVTTAIITLSYTKGQPPQFSVLLCFLTGVTTLLMSFLQLGIFNRVKSILGLSFSANGFVEEVRGVIENISDTNWQDVVVGVISLSSLYFLIKIEAIFARFGKFGPRVKKVLWLLSTSRSVTVVIVATVIFSLIGEPSPVLLVGDVPSGMPPFKPPPFSYSETNGNSTVEFSLGSALREKTSALIVIPLLAFMEHITITRAFSGTARIDAGQELLCLGVANIIGSFFSSMPVTGAFGRTALNYASGAVSPLGGLITGAIIILALVVLTPQFYYIPKSTLSSVVIMAVIFMVDFEILTSIWKSKRLDLIPWTVTFLASLFIGLEYGIMSGFVASLIFLLYYASRPGIKVSKGETGAGNEFLWVEVDRSMTFPSMEYTRYTVMKAATKWGRNELPIVIDCQFVTFADYSAAQGITDILKLFKDKNQVVFLWNVKPSIRTVWEVVMLKNQVKAIFCRNEVELDIELQSHHMALKELQDDAIKSATTTIPVDPLAEEEGISNNNFIDDEDK
ncbi:Sodium-independent sulfate anion transporter [Folsomia candida]|uniref:Sodium-independent sulfate anion transporter n=1 Tax=Folsomia candida TaxID=158441 RepID=A0A226E4P3_FOLCA|nr:Sodium-independent sulfate anion transporter [Folsomia candida]